MLGLGVIAAVAAVMYLWHRGIGGVAKDTAKAATNAITGAAAGVVVGVGEAVGIPRKRTPRSARRRRRRGVCGMRRSLTPPVIFSATCSRVARPTHRQPIPAISPTHRRC